MNLPTLSTVPSAPPCPVWCIDHVPNGCYGAEHRYSDQLDDGRQDLIVRLSRIAEPNEPEVMLVQVATQQPGSMYWTELDPDRPLSPAGAAWLGRTLSEVAAAAIGIQPVSAPAQILPGPLDRWGQGVGTVVCIDCGSEVHPDSTPDLDRCWRDAELRDIEAGQ